MEFARGLQLATSKIILRDIIEIHIYDWPESETYNYPAPSKRFKEKKEGKFSRNDSLMSKYDIDL